MFSEAFPDIQAELRKYMYRRSMTCPVCGYSGPMGKVSRGKYLISVAVDTVVVLLSFMLFIEHVIPSDVFIGLLIADFAIWGGFLLFTVRNSKLVCPACKKAMAS